MKEVFMIAKAEVKGKGKFELILLAGEYASYPEAVAAIPNGKGIYQVQKVFVRE